MADRARLSEGTMLFLELVKAIEQADDTALTDYLARFDSGFVTPEVADKWLGWLLNICAEKNQESAARIIVRKWQEESWEEDRNPTLASLFANMHVELATLVFISKLYPENSLEEYFVNWFSRDSDVRAQRAAENLAATYPHTPNNVWRVLYDYSFSLKEHTGETNPVLHDFLRTKLEETAGYLTKPAWVTNEEATLPYEEELIPAAPGPIPFPLPSVEEAVALIAGGLRIAGVTFQVTSKDPEHEDDLYKLRDHVSNLYATASIAEKIRLVRPFLDKQFNYDSGSDRQLFRIFGPANPMINMELSFEGDQCSKWGGCRMLTCVHFERRLEGEDIIDDMAEDMYDYLEWFRGNCDYCHEAIAAKHYAVRIPRVQGGWVGCYCSFEHVRADVGTADPVFTYMLQRIAQQVQEIGIQDRRYRTEPITPATTTTTPTAEQLVGEVAEEAELTTYEELPAITEEEYYEPPPYVHDL